MTHMIFMPKNATVIEIRPDKYPVKCYQYLSAVCELNFVLLLCKGDKHSNCTLNVEHFLHIVEKIYV